LEEYLAVPGLREYRHCGSVNVVTIYYILYPAPLTAEEITAIDEAGARGPQF
jgi:hypothetical protein